MLCSLPGSLKVSGPCQLPWRNCPPSHANLLHIDVTPDFLLLCSCLGGAIFSAPTGALNGIVLYYVFSSSCHFFLQIFRFILMYVYRKWKWMLFCLIDIGKSWKVHMYFSFPFLEKKEWTWYLSVTQHLLRLFFIKMWGPGGDQLYIYLNHILGW